MAWRPGKGACPVGIGLYAVCIVTISERQNIDRNMKLTNDHSYTMEDFLFIRKCTEKVGNGRNVHGEEKSEFKNKPKE